MQVDLFTPESFMTAVMYVCKADGEADVAHTVAQILIKHALGEIPGADLSLLAAETQDAILRDMGEDTLARVYALAWDVESHKVEVP